MTSSGWHFDSWSAVSVTLDISYDTEGLHISRASQLRIIDHALPGIAAFSEEKRLKIGADYCRFVQGRLTLMFGVQAEPDNRRSRNYKGRKSAIKLGDLSSRQTSPPALPLPSVKTDSPGVPNSEPPVIFSRSSPPTVLSPSPQLTIALPLLPPPPPPPSRISPLPPPPLLPPPPPPPRISTLPPPPTVSSNSLPARSPSSPHIPSRTQSPVGNHPSSPPPVPSRPGIPARNQFTPPPGIPSRPGCSVGSQSSPQPLTRSRPASTVRNQSSPPSPTSSGPGSTVGGHSSPPSPTPSRPASRVVSHSSPPSPTPSRPESAVGSQSSPASPTPSTPGSTKGTLTPKSPNGETTFTDLPGTMEDAIELFIRIIDFFYTSWGKEIDCSISDFKTANPDIQIPESQVRDIFGIWLCLHRLTRPHMVEYSEPMTKYLALVQAFPPAINWLSSDPMPEKPTYVFTKALGEGLVDIASVKLARTWDMASHLYFDRSARVLYLFMTAGVCYSVNSPDTNSCIPTNFTSEIARSFKLLFDLTPGGRKVLRDFQKDSPSLKPLLPSKLGRSSKFGDLWNYEGFSRDIRIRGPNMPLGDYELRDFSYFGERLLVLERFLAETRPGTLRQLMKDSRDQLQYYTFVVAIVVFIMTVLGLILAILQTIASYWQVKLALASAS